MSKPATSVKTPSEHELLGARVENRHIEAARAALLDTLTVSFLAVHEDVVPVALSYAVEQPGARSLVWTTAATTSAEAAAFANATIAHALDFDDVAPQWRGHPSAVLFPALMAVAPDAPLHAILAAYVQGYAYGAWVGGEVGDEHYRRGWHATSTVGALAAACACACLLGLDPSQTRHAISIAASQAAGMQTNFGTTTKPAQAGFAAAAAVRSVSLARLGLEASPDAVDGLRGFVGLYGGRPAASSSFAPDTDAVLRLEAKRFPSCHATHRAVLAALRLRDRLGPTVAGADRISIVNTPNLNMPLLKRKPVTATEARFSIEYCVAAALLDGRLDMSSFGPQSHRRPDVQALQSRVVLSDEHLPNVVRASRVMLGTGDIDEVEEVAGPLATDLRGVLAKADENLVPFGGPKIGTALDAAIEQSRTLGDLFSSETLRALAARFVSMRSRQDSGRMRG
jgi:2-methylcitrate dehydratase PrpD